MRPETAARLESFRTIEAGWDSYDGKPIDPRAIDAARAFLERIGDECQEMGVFPTVDGGVQVESMGAGKLALEFDFAPDGSCRGFFFDMANGDTNDIKMVLDAGVQP